MPSQLVERKEVRACRLRDAVPQNATPKVHHPSYMPNALDICRCSLKSKGHDFFEASSVA
jgi:hypothetical protein